MEDDLVLLQAADKDFRKGIDQILGRNLTGEESYLLQDKSFFFQRRKSSLISRYGGQKYYTRQQMLDFGGDSKRLRGTSSGLSVRGISQNDFTRLSNLDLFRGAGVDDVTNTKISETTYKMNQQGQIARTKGDALSLLQESDLESLAEVVSGRQSQIVGNALSPGLSNQGFSLLSGNFGR